MIWTCFLLFQLRCRRDISPPQQEKVRRPPGYSLSLRLDDLLATILQALVWTTVMLLTATASAVSLIRLGRFHMNGGSGAVGYIVFFAALFVVSAIPSVALVSRALKKTIEARNTRRDAGRASGGGGLA